MPSLRAYVIGVWLAFTFAPPAPAADKVKVVASFSIMADLVRQVGRDHVDVTALVGPNTDMHVFEPNPSDAKTLASANLVVINGLGFEGWADRLVKASGFKGATVVASAAIKPLAAADHGGHRHGGKAQAHGRYDPHAWQAVANVKIYVSNIRDALIVVNGSNRESYTAAAADYLKRLDALEIDIKAAFEGLPKPQRRVITSHEAFTYYGAAYGIEFLAPQGVGGDAEATAKAVAALVRQIKRERVKAVFVENISNPRLIEQIARETGVRIGGALYSDALSGPSGPAATYIDMMRYNTRLLAEAMN